MDNPVPPRRRRGYFLPGTIALVAMVAIGTAIAGAGDLSHRPPHELAGPDMDQQIAAGMQSQFGAATPPPVDCPAREPVAAGTRFDCRLGAWRGSPPRPVHVVEFDGRGHLRWSLGTPSTTSPTT